MLLLLLLAGAGNPIIPVLPITDAEDDVDMKGLILGQTNAIEFVMINSASTELPGLGTAFVVQVSKNGAGFVAGAGVKSELGDGFYRYVLTAAECNTVGPLSVQVDGAGALQQNLVYLVRGANAGAVAWLHTITSGEDSQPVGDIDVWAATDSAGDNRVAEARTDAFGVATLYLQPGTYYFFKYKTGWTFTNPKQVVVT